MIYNTQPLEILIAYIYIYIYIYTYIYNIYIYILLDDSSLSAFYMYTDSSCERRKRVRLHYCITALLPNYCQIVKTGQPEGLNGQGKTQSQVDCMRAKSVKEWRHNQ